MRDFTGEILLSCTFGRGKHAGSAADHETVSGQAAGHRLPRQPLRGKSRRDVYERATTALRIFSAELRLSVN